MKISKKPSRISNIKKISAILHNKLDSENSIGRRNIISARRAYFNSTECSPVSNDRPKRSGMSLETSPEQAASVIKDYILPMFKAKEVSKHARKRSEVYGNFKGANFKEIGMLSDFKLVDKLNSELRSQKSKNQNIDFQLKQANQEREIYHSEYKVLKDQVLQAEINLSLLEFSQAQSSKNEADYSFVKEQYAKYKSLYEQESSRYEDFYKVFEEEKIKNSHLENKMTQLEHVNTILVLQNDILGEKLKELYRSIAHLLGKNSIHEKLKSEYFLVIESLKNLAEHENLIFNQFSDFSKEKEKLDLLASELSNISSVSGDKKDKIIRYFKEQNSKLTSDFKNTSIIKEKLKIDLENLEKKYESLQDEFIKLRVKMSTNKIKNLDFNEEKYCVNCQKPFVESLNYNWSCKRHPNSYSDGIYWCCGKKDKNSVGCVSTFHVSSEGKFDEKNDVKNDNFSMFCFCCHEHGHHSNECPKDPNARSNYDPNEELERIKTIKKSKNKTSMNYFNDRQGIASLLNIENAFNAESSDSDFAFEPDSVDDSYMDILFNCKLFIK